ncbi:MAG: hypothetical protein H7196_02405 [candidate division SR1 bacterium]|nr:hypothetical protein [candidate division SR1 bacterium]
MSQPNLQEIKDISILLDQIEEYKHLIDSANIQLQNTKEYYKSLESVEKSKIYNDLKQKSNLIQLNNDIQEYRKQEMNQKISIISDLNNYFDDFFESDEAKTIIVDVIKTFKDEPYEVYCDSKYQSILSPGQNYKKTTEGNIRICSETKEYTLDPKYLNPLVFEQLLISAASEN